MAICSTVKEHLDLFKISFKNTKNSADGMTAVDDNDNDDDDDVALVLVLVSFKTGDFHSDMISKEAFLT
jgi:hypothetical protein